MQNKIGLTFWEKKVFLRLRHLHTAGLAGNRGIVLIESSFSCSRKKKILFRSHTIFTTGEQPQAFLAVREFFGVSGFCFLSINYCIAVIFTGFVTKIIVPISPNTTVKKSSYFVSIYHASEALWFSPATHTGNLCQLPAKGFTWIVCHRFL